MTHCQICARSIKLVRGAIAHHGYTRPGYGYQTASCPGAKHLAYEVSRDAIPPHRDFLANWLEERCAALTDLETNPPASLTVYPLAWGWNKPGKPIQYARPENFNPASVRSSIPRTYENAYANRRRELGYEIRALGEDVKFLTERYDTWVALAEEAA